MPSSILTSSTEYISINQIQKKYIILSTVFDVEH